MKYFDVLVKIVLVMAWLTLSLEGFLWLRNVLEPTDSLMIALLSLFLFLLYLFMWAISTVFVFFIVKSYKFEIYPDEESKEK